MYGAFIADASVKPTTLYYESGHVWEERVVLIGTEINWTEEKIINLIRDTFPEEPEMAIAIAKCESSLNPKAYNGSNTNGTSDSGLWQINTVHTAKLAEMGIDPFDPKEATKFARYLYEESGWQPWVCTRMI